MNSKYYRDRGLSCSGAVSTTGSSPNSTLEWAPDHIHPPDNSKIRARVICQDVRERATTEPTATPQLTTTDSLIGAAPDVNLSLPLLLRAYLDWYTCGAQRAAESTYVTSCFVERPRASLHSDDSDHQRSRVVSTPCSAARHPTIWVLLKALHCQQALTDNTLAHIARGEQKPVTAKQTTHNARIVTLVSTYSSNNVDRTL